MVSPTPRLINTLISFCTAVVSRILRTEYYTAVISTILTNYLPQFRDLILFISTTQ